MNRMAAGDGTELGVARRVAWIAVVGCLSACGCIPRYGTGGTGEWVVPRHRLHEIERLDLAAYSHPIPADVSAQPPPIVAPVTEPAATEPAATRATEAPLAGTAPDLASGPLRPIVPIIDALPGVSPSTAPSPLPTTGPATAPALGPRLTPAAAPLVTPTTQAAIQSTTQPAALPAPPTTEPALYPTATPAPSTRSATAPTTAPVVPPRPTTRPAEPLPEVALTVADARRLALENNLDLKVELLNPAISRTSLTEEEARFEALFTVNASLAKTDAAVASQLTGSQTEGLQINPGFEIPLRTGGAIRIGAPINRFSTNNVFSTLNPAYSSAASVSISQPLLRGGGLDVNAQGIRVAFYGYQSAQARTKLEVIRVLADVERVYWRLYAARQELTLRRQEYDLAVAQLDRARREARVGVVPEVDVIRAESGVADRVESIIIAENAVRDRQRELKRVMNAPGLEMETPQVLVPTTNPTAVAYNLDGAALAKSAMKGRMELLEEALRIAEQSAAIRVARNATLPLVTLDYTYNINGLGPSLDDSLSQVREKRFEDHRVGVRVEVPIGNEAALSRLRRAALTRYQALATRDARALLIRQEVLNAVDQLEANWQRIIAARQRVVLADRVVEVESRQFTIGLRTSTDVLDAQTRLANARLSEISAVTEYQIAQVDIAFATGSVLGASRVIWNPTVAPEERSRR